MLQAARVRCTVGEISDALERAWGRHAASAGVAPGYYVTEREAAATGVVVAEWRYCSAFEGSPCLGAPRARRGGASSCPVQD